MPPKLPKPSPVLSDPTQSKLQAAANALPSNAILKGVAEGPDPEGARVGVWGYSERNVGVWATSKESIGLRASGAQGAAVFDGTVEIDDTLRGNKDGIIMGQLRVHNGLYAETKSAGTVAIRGDNSDPDGWAGYFEGQVEVTGTLTVHVDIVLEGGDCAEEFDVVSELVVEPGTVMVLCDEGMLEPSMRAYDKRVAGVIAGAGDLRPGLVLGKRPQTANRLPVALLGKVFCKVDASYGSIGVGDLLTSSPTPGFAMRADDPLKAFGAVIGKALRPLMGGQGLIPILIALQ